MAALWSGGVNVGARGHGAGHLSLLVRDEGTWFSRLRFKWLVICMIECALHMQVSDSNCTEFRDKIPFKEGRI